MLVSRWFLWWTLKLRIKEKHGRHFYTLYLHIHFMPYLNQFPYYDRSYLNLAWILIDNFFSTKTSCFLYSLEMNGKDFFQNFEYLIQNYHIFWVHIYFLLRSMGTICKVNVYFLNCPHSVWLTLCKTHNWSLKMAGRMLRNLY